MRDVEAGLSANSTKLYAMGFRSAVKRSTLADANESRDWRIWSDLAAVLIRRARKLYASDFLGVELDNTVYALDSSTVDLCLGLFDWAPFRSTKAAIELHTLLDLRGAVPAFIHISDGKMDDVNMLDMLSFEAGAFFVTRAKRGMDARRVYSNVSSSARVLPATLPTIAEAPLASAPSLVRPQQPPGVDQVGLRYDVFISHATEDKVDIVRPLASGPVAESLSILLPVWHQLTKQEVVAYSPSGSDKLARNSATHAVDEIAKEIAELLKST